MEILGPRPYDSNQLLIDQAYAQAEVDNGPQGFNDSTRHIDITDQERAIGITTHRLFVGKLKRLPPWFIRGGDNPSIQIVKGLSPSELEQNPLFEQLPILRFPSIILEPMAREPISPSLARVIYNFKRVEDKLADYTGRANQTFRNYWGIMNSYNQWGFEENQHSEALGLILAMTGQMPIDEQEAQYYDNLAQTWEQPFATPRQMVVYAAFQERMTSLTYKGLRDHALKNGAPTMAEILGLISHDEAYHGGGYTKFAQVFYEIDPNGTIADTLYVAERFRMPAQNLTAEPKADLMATFRVGAYSKDMVSQGTILKTLLGLGYIDPDLAKKTADNYWKKAS